MKLLRYNDLDPAKLKPQFERTAALLEAGDFRGADVKKLAPGPFYRAKLSDADRLIFRFGAYRGETYLILLEIVRNHAYETSRFLRGAAVDESRLVPVPKPAPLEPRDVIALNYVNSKAPRVHVLDKILSFDEIQESALLQRPPLILIGSAGSGKTVLTLEKLRQLSGEILYVTRSSYLVDNARNLYYSNHYENDGQEVEFLSFLEFVQSIAVPPGRPMAFADFAAWFNRQRGASPIKDAHPVFEEFNGVLTGSAVTRPYLSLDDYLALGVRRSIFTGEDRPAVYALFRRYLEFVAASGAYDLNLVCYHHHARCRPTYDFVVADEVQDLTSVQLSLILKSLRFADQFVLCGDSNQIVHPNFFSWAGVKSYFYEQRLQGRAEIIRVLNTNYRNSPEVTELANRLLLIKNARFGSIDRESHYLIRPVSENAGRVEFYRDEDAVRRDIDAKTGRSARFAVLVMRDEDKEEARRSFRTPLVFSVQEAKGLEYENIILLNFVSGSARAFGDLVAGVTADDLKGEFTYARAADKSDKSLEAYKFFVNALYVAVTRAVRSLHVLERNTSHPLFSLLGLRLSGDAAALAEQQSSVEEWKAEALRLERQGKAEQAEAIRRTVLHTEPVPWQVLTPASLDAFATQTLQDAPSNRKAMHLLLDYAATYSVTPLLARLAAAGMKSAERPEAARFGAQQRHTQDYHQRGYRDLRRKLALHGVDFRDPLNRTPLMIAAPLGLVGLVQDLVREGAKLDLRDNWGRIPLQLALRAAYQDPHYARNVLGQIYTDLAPDAVRLRVAGRLVKVDSHRMEFFLLHSMMALFEFILRTKIQTDIPAFETGDFVHALEHFPKSVLDERRRRREAITAVLARNEVFRVGPYNRRLFVRVQRGFYVPNPAMDIEMGDAWVNVFDLLHLDELEREKHDPRLARFVEGIRLIRRDVETRLRAEDVAGTAPAADVPIEPAAGPSAPSGPVEPAPRPVAEPIPSAAGPPVPPETAPAPEARPASTEPAAPPPPALSPARVEPDASAHPPAEREPAPEEPAAATPSPMPAAPAEGEPPPRLERQAGGESEPSAAAPAVHSAEADVMLSVVEDAIAHLPRRRCERTRACVTAMFGLAKLRDARAFSLFVRFARLPAADHLLGDNVTEDLGRLLASVFDGNLAALESLIGDKVAGPESRAGGVHALAVLVLHGGLDRGEAIRLLRRLMDVRRGILALDDHLVWDAVAEAAYWLHPGDLLDSLHHASRYGLLTHAAHTMRDMIKQARRPAEEVLRESAEDEVEGFITDERPEASTWYPEEENEPSPPPRPPVRPRRASRRGVLADLSERLRARWAQPAEFAHPPPSEPMRVAPKTGRNDPCPCGSGRKFKKCCGR